MGTNTQQDTQPKIFHLKQTRGDTWGYKFQRTDTSKEVIMEAPDEMYFTVKNSFNDQTPVIQKTLDEMYMDESGYWHFTITPQDTDNLPYGKYVGDVERIIGDDVKTIAKGTFTLTEESTWALNQKGANNA